MTLAERIININEYRLVGTADDYTAAISAIAERVEREGHPGVLGYHFYLNEAGGTAGAAIIYADAQAWLEHHQMLRSWEEMARFGQTIEFQRAVIFGPISDEMREYIGPNTVFADHGELAAGFVRSQLADG